jgi:NAD(P)-dependent dehydrogenase (short-subunit alcohol dehydrogenase family)
MAVVMITGCSSGFGFASALAFARAGDRVYATVRELAKGAELAKRAATERLDIRPVALDVTRAATFPAVIDAIVAESGRIDVLVNNAGILRPGAFEDVDEPTLREVMETNFFAPFLLARSVLPQMRRQRSGYIIMISSLSGIAGLAGDVAYAASKFAVEGASEALRHEVDRFGIRLALVEAGLYATGIFAKSITPDTLVPPGYPADSPYRALVEYRLAEVRARMPQAFDPGALAALLVRIARSDGRQLRWPADPVAEKVLATMLGQDDAARDAFLRGVSGTDWWSAGAESPQASTPRPR